MDMLYGGFAPLHVLARQPVDLKSIQTGTVSFIPTPSDRERMGWTPVQFCRWGGGGGGGDFYSVEGRKRLELSVLRVCGPHSEGRVDRLFALDRLSRSHVR